MQDGSLLFVVWSSSETVHLQHVTGPGQVKSLGKVGHSARAMSFSRDLQRATITSRQATGDAWMYRVVKP